MGNMWLEWSENLRKEELERQEQQYIEDADLNCLLHDIQEKGVSFC